MSPPVPFYIFKRLKLITLYKCISFTPLGQPFGTFTSFNICVPMSNKEKARHHGYWVLKTFKIEYKLLTENFFYKLMSGFHTMG